MNPMRRSLDLVIALKILVDGAGEKVYEYALKFAAFVARPGDKEIDLKRS